ncbi:hypothetical protein CZ771_00815 [Actinomycetales bacterium JB111]|nr:hypothetical protein CZ771_00815 [Actinomycetales bacterium JB111]
MCDMALPCASCCVPRRAHKLASPARVGRLNQRSTALSRHPVPHGRRRSCARGACPSSSRGPWSNTALSHERAVSGMFRAQNVPLTAPTTKEWPIRPSGGRGWSRTRPAAVDGA